MSDLRLTYLWGKIIRLLVRKILLSTENNLSIILYHSKFRSEPSSTLPAPAFNEVMPANSVIYSSIVFSDCPAGRGNFQNVGDQYFFIMRINFFNILICDDEERLQVAVIEQLLGASLFASALLTGSSWQSRHVQAVL
jgi:hypothetical protein